MTSELKRPDVASIRAELQLTQQQFAELLSLSVRAVHSYEQGWRSPSPGVERTLWLLLVAHRRGAGWSAQKCWKTQQCPRERRAECIAYRTRQGHLCWFLTGRHRGDRPAATWEEKWSLCRRCRVLQELVEPAD